MNHRTASLLFGLALLITGPPGRAGQIHVPGDWPTIQAAIEAAGALDTVVVAPGVYEENVRIEGKSTRLVSQYAIDGNIDHIRNTVIDGSQPAHPDSASVIRLINAGDVLVRGFTLTGGKGTLWLDQSDGHLYREGGGILAEGGSPRIYDNLIIDNSAANRTGATSSGGGAVRCGFGSADIRGNVFAYNEGRYGGALVLFHDVGTVLNNIFYRNWGGEDFGGGAIWATSGGGQHVFRNNTIVENRSALDGGGVLLWANSATTENNIIWGNRAASNPQISLRSGASGSTFTYSDVEGGATGTGNIAAPPLFSDANLHLDLASSCVDAGNPSIVQNDPPDPSDATLARAPARGLRRNDMGAYGGPGMHEFPSFNAPGLALQPATLNFDTVAVGSNRILWLKIGKSDFGMLFIDSSRIVGDPRGTLVTTTPLPLKFGLLATDSLDSIAIEWTPSTYGQLKDTLFLFHSEPGTPNPMSVVLEGFAPGQTGDVNFDGVMTAADIIYLVNYTFKGGPPPRPVARSGDVNCDTNVTSADIIYLVNFVFKGGMPPCT